MCRHEALSKKSEYFHMLPRCFLNLYLCVEGILIAGIRYEI